MKIHFIGIGGIGVSALAKYYLEKGHKITGSDLVFSEIIQDLKKRGAKIFTLHRAKNLPRDANLVIYSPAVQDSNLELKKARRLRIKCLSYPQALGELTKQYFTIAISGTHGKSTVTAMVGLLLKKAGFDPTVIVGTKLKEFKNSNCRVGKSKYLVIEADEWQAAFLNYFPKIIVLTNIEKEHLDYYKNLSHILKTYREYISHLSKNGVLIVNKDDKNLVKITKQKQKFVNNTFSTAVENVLGYSLKQEEIKKLRKILKIPGEHNVSNALAALTVARVLKIPDRISFNALSKYKGSWRRFEERKITINNKQLTIISDYAHHPTEIKAILRAAREKFGKRKIWCIFQPHQYQRTFYLFQDFVKVFREALRQAQGKPLIDKLIITDIYDVAGREQKRIKAKVSSEKLVKAIKNKITKRIMLRSIIRSNKLFAENVLYLSNFKKIERYLKKNLQGSPPARTSSRRSRAGEVVIIMGAGDIYKLFEQF